MTRYTDKQRLQRKGNTMTCTEFETKLDDLITEAYNDGLNFSDIIAVVEAKLKEIEQED